MQGQTVVVSLECDLSAEELNDEARVWVRVGLERTADGDKGAVGCLQAVLALLEENQGDGGVLAPRNGLVRVEHVAFQVHIRLSVDVADAHPAETSTCET